MYHTRMLCLLRGIIFEKAVLQVSSDTASQAAAAWSWLLLFLCLSGSALDSVTGRV